MSQRVDSFFKETEIFSLEVLSSIEVVKNVDPMLSGKEERHLEHVRTLLQRIYEMMQKAEREDSGCATT